MISTSGTVGTYSVTTPSGDGMNAGTIRPMPFSIQMPTIDVETKEIKEGNNPRIHSVLTGFSNSGEVELEMALWPWSVDMFVYFAQAMYGRYSPRRSFLVVNLKNEKSIPWRVLLLESCVPKQWVPSSALDANTTEVLVETMTLDVHRIVPVAAPIPSFPINQIPSTPRGGQY